MLLVLVLLLNKKNKLLHDRFICRFSIDGAVIFVSNRSFPSKARICFSCACIQPLQMPVLLPLLRRHGISNARMLPLLRRHATQYKHKVQPRGWTNKNIQAIDWLQFRQVEKNPVTSAFTVRHLVNLFVHFNNIELFHKAKSIFLAIPTTIYMNFCVTPPLIWDVSQKPFAVARIYWYWSNSIIIQILWLQYWIQDKTLFCA